MSKKDAPQAIWTRAGMTIRPVNDIAEAMLRSRKSGEDFIGTFRNPRSLKQLRLWWGLMNILVEHNIFALPEAASRAVKIATGHCDELIMPDTGQVFLVPQSIAFESLAQDKFNPIMAAAIEVICQRWIPTDATTLRREVFKALDPPGAQGERIK